MKSIKLPFGLNENNVLIHITDAERGKQCNCICPDCGSLLIASKGRKNQPHFKHTVINACKGGLESAIHLAAKKFIREKKQITLSKCISIASGKDSKGKEHIEQKTVVESGTIINFDLVQEEIELHEMRADILAMKYNKPLMIEVFYRHKVEDQKLAKIAAANISAIEVNLSDLTPENVKDWEAFGACINDPKRVKWLYNAKAHDYLPTLEKQLINTIREQEKKYEQEQFEKKRKEQREKNRLLQALNELKILSGEKSIAKIKHEAASHPFWKNNAYLPFSLDNLPHYVNVDIPDGD